MQHVRHSRAALLLAVALCTMAGTTQAQNFNVSGQWYCQHAMEPFSGNAYDKHYWEFMLYAQPNGTFQLQGMYYNSVVGNMPVQAQGTYGQRQDFGGAIVFEGRMMRGDGNQQHYSLAVNPADASTMYYQFAGNTHMTNASCRR